MTTEGSRIILLVAVVLLVVPLSGCVTQGQGSFDDVAIGTKTTGIFIPSTVVFFLHGTSSGGQGYAANPEVWPAIYDAVAKRECVHVHFHVELIVDPGTGDDHMIDSITPSTLCEASR